MPKLKKVKKVKKIKKVKKVKSFFGVDIYRNFNTHNSTKCNNFIRKR